MSVNLTTAERVELVLPHAKQGGSPSSIVDIINARYSNKQPISQRTLLKILLVSNKQEESITDFVEEEEKLTPTLKQLNRCAMDPMGPTGSNFQ